MTAQFFRHQSIAIVLFNMNGILFQLITLVNLKCSGTSTIDLQPCLDPPKSKWHNGQSRLLNQTFISAECVRPIRLSTDKSQVFSVDCKACDSCPHALSLIGCTHN